jgi:hypothetical protein
VKGKIDVVNMAVGIARIHTEVERPRREDKYATERGKCQERRWGAVVKRKYTRLENKR